ncbi:hypothetical protein GJ496_012072 [Pomphorhynchus laevis]|nr:hypothetical protein GJ496_012072 [Pomphorhynchus laevis]
MDDKQLNELVESNSSALLEQICYRQNADILKRIKVLNENYSEDLHMKLRVNDDELDKSVYKFIANQINIYPIKETGKRLHETVAVNSFDDVVGIESFSTISSNDKKNFILNKVLKINDVVYCEITNISSKGALVRLICCDLPNIADLEDASICGFIRHNLLSDNLNEGDLIKAKIVNIAHAQSILTLSCSKDDESGQVKVENLPLFFRMHNVDRRRDMTFNKMLRSNQKYLSPGFDWKLIALCKINMSSESLIKKSLLMNIKNEVINDVEKAANIRSMQDLESANNLYAKGMNFFQTNNESNAIRCFNAALEYAEYHVESLLARGAMQANKHNFKEALKDLQYAYDLNPENKTVIKYLCRVLCALANWCAYRKDNDSALKFYQRVLDYDKNFQTAIDGIDKIKRSIEKKLEIFDHTPALPRQIRTNETNDSCSFNSDTTSTESCQSSQSSSSSECSISCSSSSSNEDKHSQRLKGMKFDKQYKLEKMDVTSSTNRKKANHGSSRTVLKRNKQHCDKIDSNIVDFFHRLKNRKR